MHFGVPGRSQGSVDGASLLPTLHLHPLGAIRAGSPWCKPGGYSPPMLGPPPPSLSLSPILSLSLSLFVKSRLSCLLPFQLLKNDEHMLPPLRQAQVGLHF